MSARIVAVHDDATLLRSLTVALRAAGHDVASFADPMLAWSGLAASRNVDLLVTRIVFASGKPHGIALARWVRERVPGVRILFVAEPGFQSHVDGIGFFLPAPASAPIVAGEVRRILASRPQQYRA